MHRCSGSVSLSRSTIFLEPGLPCSLSYPTDFSGKHNHVQATNAPETLAYLLFSPRKPLVQSLARKMVQEKS
jgi:hypothetical protein